MANFYYGSVTEIGESRTGTSQSGTQWKMTDFVLASGTAASPRHTVLTYSGDSLQVYTMDEKGYCHKVEGETVEVIRMTKGRFLFDVDAREYTDKEGKKRWFNSVRCWGIVKNEHHTAAPSAPTQAAAPAQSAAPSQAAAPAVNTDGLPF